MNPFTFFQCENSVLSNSNSTHHLEFSSLASKALVVLAVLAASVVLQMVASVVVPHHPPWQAVAQLKRIRQPRWTLALELSMEFPEVPFIGGR